MRPAGARYGGSQSLTSSGSGTSMSCRRHARLDPLDHGLDHARRARSVLTRRRSRPRARAAGRCERACPRPPPCTASHFSRLRQSSSVSFHDLSGSSCARSNRRSCSSFEMCIQNLTRIDAVVDELLLELVDLVVGALPFLARWRNPRRARRGRGRTRSGRRSTIPPSLAASPEAPEVVVALFVGGRRRELDDVHVARVELGDEPLDRAALARGVRALEHDAHRRPQLARADLPTQGQAKLGEPRPCVLAGAPPPCARATGARSTSSSRLMATGPVPSHSTPSRRSRE